MKYFIHTDISMAARRFPDNIALWDDGKSLTYASLDQRSDALANWLMKQLPGSKHRIALVLPKTIDAIIAIVGILKSGNTYVPLGDTWSSGRLEKIFQDGEFSQVITDSVDRNLSWDDDRTLIVGSDYWQRLITTELEDGFHPPKIDEHTPAYMLYTSGSTGTPKGVCVTHRAARHFPAWACGEFGLTKDDRVASVSPLTFDLTTFDLFSTLATGATLYLVPEKLKVFPARLSDFLQEHRISIIYAVPSTLILLMQRGKLDKRNLRALRTVLFAGEEFPIPLFMKFKELLHDDIEYANLYGPTETNVCTYYRVPSNFNLDRMPIGRALPDTHLFIRPGELGELNNERGELCVAGPTIMSGYYGYDDKDAEYWGPDPRGIESKAYATGDQVSFGPDELWYYHGRIDSMVKIWGYRVELGEVESCLNAMPNVEQVAVIKHSGNDQPDKRSGGDSLMAFIQLKKYDRLAPSMDSFQKEAILHCRDNLPPYMIPREFRLVDVFPLSNNGKIDRLKLTQFTSEPTSK